MKIYINNDIVLIVFFQTNERHYVRFVNRYLENLFGFVTNDSKDLRQAFQIHIDIFDGINDENYLL